VVRSHFILVFFDFGASCYLIPGNSSASHSIYTGILWQLAQEVRISIGSWAVITYLIKQTISLYKEYQYEWFSRFRTSVSQSCGIFYIIPVMILVPSLDFTEFSHDVQLSLWTDEPWTSLTSPSKSHVLAMQAQPDVGLTAPRCLAFSAMLRADFAAWALLSASLAEH